MSWRCIALTLAKSPAVPGGLSCRWPCGHPSSCLLAALGASTPTPTPTLQSQPRTLSSLPPASSDSLLAAITHTACPHSVPAVMLRLPMGPRSPTPACRHLVGIWWASPQSTTSEGGQHHPARPLGVCRKTLSVPSIPLETRIAPGHRSLAARSSQTPPLCPILVQMHVSTLLPDHYFPPATFSQIAILGTQSQ